MRRKAVSGGVGVASQIRGPATTHSSDDRGTRHKLTNIRDWPSYRRFECRQHGPHPFDSANFSYTEWF